MAIQILRNTGATLQETFSAGAADGSVTITITRADGTAVVTGAATTHGTGGVYTYVLAPQTELDLLTTVWSGTWGGVAQSITTEVEIVGALLFPVSAARTFGDLTLKEQTKYPDAAIRETRERITDMFEHVCGVSFVPRYARDVLDGLNETVLHLTRRRPTRIISGSIDTVALTGDDIANIALYPAGTAVRKSTWSSPWGWSSGRQNIVLVYEHGYSSPPADIQRAALTLARYELVSNDISDRMIAFDNDLGQVRLSVPGRNYPTGIPLVDATLARYDVRPLLV